MTRIMLDAKWGRYHVLQNLLYALPGGAALVSTFLGYTPPIFAVLAVLAAVGVGIAADVWRFTHYACNECQRPLRAPDGWWGAKRSPGPIAFTCSHCDIVWTTRLSAEE